MTIVNIQDYTQSSVSKRVEIELIQYNLNSSAVVNVNFMDSEDNKISSQLVSVDGDDFSVRWNTDEDLVNIVLEKLGLTKS